MRQVFLAVMLLLDALVGVTVYGTPAEVLKPGHMAPDIADDSWINSPPLTISGLRGRVVLVEFWTYG
jgi:hypothetical protein